MKTIWGRMGVSFSITDEEEKAILDGDSSLVSEIMRKVVGDGRFYPNGDSYIPEESVELFNKQYGAEYEVNEISFDI